MTHLLLGSSSAVECLRADIAGAKAKQWAELLPEIERCCARPYVRVDHFAHDYETASELTHGNAWAGLCAAFGYLATGERRFFDSARDHLMPMLSWQRWSLPYSCSDGSAFDLEAAAVVKAFSLLLDWCGDAISEDERSRIILALENFGARAALHDDAVKIGWYDESGFINNWVAVMNGCMGLAALLLWRERPIFRETLSVCVRHIRRYLDWVEEDGCTAEAGGYWSYGMTHLLILLEALRMNRDNVPPEVLETGVCDWLTQTPKLSRTAMFPLLGGLDGRFAMLFGDCDPEETSHFMAPCALLARTFRDESVQWHVRRMRCIDPLALLWFDPSLPGRAPEPGRIARIFSSIGWLLVRESPAVENGFFFTVRGGHNRQTHCHWDLGTFLFWYAGEPLICDPGRPTYCEEFWRHPERFYKKTSFGHNVVIVDGTGQAGGKDTCGTMRDISGKGPTRKYELDMRSPNNGIARQRRSFELDLRREPVIIMEDDVETSGESAVEFLFHHRGEVRIEGNSAWITRPQAELRLDFESSVPLKLTAVAHEEMDYLSVKPQERARRRRLRVVMKCTNRRS